MRLITPQLPEVEMRNSPNVTKDDSERVYIYNHNHSALLGSWMKL